MDLGVPVDCDVVIIDGHSGSGKTALADRLAAEMRSAGLDPQLLRVEDLYPGWDGLAEGSRALARALDDGRYRRYDWIAGEFGEEAEIDPRVPLIIEGCGAITRENLAAAERWMTRQAPHGTVRTIWLEAPEELRQRRALARDGDVYAPHWERWASQERAHYDVHRPWLLADEVTVN